MKKKGVLFFLGFFLSMLILGCGSSSEKETSENVITNPSVSTITINGYVIDEPIEDATIEVYDKKGNLLVKKENATDEVGRFEVNVTGEPYKVIAYLNNNKLYESTFNQNKQLILSPLSLFDDIENELSYKLETLYDYIYTIENLKNVLHLNKISPHEFNNIINTSNKQAIIEKLPKNEDVLNAKCFYNLLKPFPKKVICVAKGNVLWKYKDISTNDEVFIFTATDLNQVNLTYIDNNITKIFTIYGGKELSKKLVQIDSSVNNDIKIDKYNVSIPANSLKNNSLTLKVLEGRLTENTLSNKILEVSPSEDIAANKSLTIEIPLNDDEYYYASKGKLVILKKDENGEIFLTPVIDKDRKVAIVNINTFSQLQSIIVKNEINGEFISDQLNENKDFYNFLNDLIHNDMNDLQLLTILQDLKDGNEYLIDKLNTKIVFDYKECSIADALVTLYNELVFYENLYDNNGNVKYLSALEKIYSVNVNENYESKMLFDVVKDFFVAYKNNDFEIKYKYINVTVKFDEMEVPINMSDFLKYFTNKSEEFIGWTSLIEKTLNNFDIYGKFLIINDVDDSIEWIDAFNNLYSELFLNSYVAYVYGVYLNVNKKILENAIKAINNFSESLNSVVLNQIFNEIGEPKDINGYYEDFKNSTFFESYFNVNDDGTISPIGRDIKFTKYDIVTLYYIYQKYTLHKIDIDAHKEWIKTQIAFILSLYKNILNNNLDFTINVASNEENEFYFDDNEKLITININNKDIVLKNINVIVKNKSNDDIILNKTLEEVNSDENVSIYGNELDLELNKKYPLVVEIKGDVYENGVLWDNKLYPFDVKKTTEIVKIEKKIPINKELVLTNVNFRFDQISIGKCGNVSLHLINDGNLAQFGNFKINGYISFIDDNGKEFYSSWFEKFSFDDSGTWITLSDPVNAKIISKLSSNQHLKLSADFSFDDPKLQKKFVLKDYQEDFEVPYNVEKDNYFEINNYVKINLSYQFIGLYDEEGYDAVTIEKNCALNEKVKGVLEVWKDNKKIQTVDFIQCLDDCSLYRNNYETVRIGTLFDVPITKINDGNYTIKVFINGIETNRTFELVNNKPPIAILKVSKTEINKGEEVTLDASESYDVDGEIKKYEIKDINGKLVCENIKCTVKPSETSTFVLTVTDDENLTNATSITINVINTNNSPVAKLTASKYEINKGESVVLYATESYDPDGSIIKYEIFDENGNVICKTKECEVKPDKTTSYNLKVTDNNNLIDEDTITINVFNMPISEGDEIENDENDIKPTFQLSLLDESLPDYTKLKINDLDVIKKIWTVKNVSNHKAHLILEKDESKPCNLTIIETSENVNELDLDISDSDNFVVNYKMPTKEGTYECYYKVKDNSGNYYNIDNSNNIWVKVVIESDPLLVNIDLNQEIVVNDNIILMIQINKGTSPFNISIDWGDMSKDVFTINENSMVKNHQYTKSGIYDVTVSIKDNSNKTYTKKYIVTVNDTIPLNSKWEGVVDAVKATGYNTGDTPVNILVSNEEYSGINVNTYKINYTMEPDDVYFYTGYKLEVPKEIISLDKKVRVTYITQVDITSGFWNYDREFWIKTDNKKYGAVFVDNRDGLNSSGGMFIIKDLETGITNKYGVSDFIDEVVNNKGISTYALELDGGIIRIYKYIKNDDGRYEYKLIFDYLDDIGSYLTQLHLDFKGNSKIILAYLQYDKNNNGEYEENESIILNSFNKIVDWSKFEDVQTINTNVDIDKSLVAWYPFDGDFKDYSTFRNDGVLYGNAEFVEGVFNKGIKFGGYENPGFISVNNTPELSFLKNFTFTFWFNIQGVYGMDGYGSEYEFGSQTIFAKSGDREGINVRVGQLKDKPGYFNFWIHNGNCCLSNNASLKAFDDPIESTIKMNEWHFGAIKADDFYIYIYLDGKLMNKELLSEFELNPLMASSILRIGINEWGYWYPFNGIIDDFRVYNRALTDLEIEELFYKK